MTSYSKNSRGEYGAEIRIDGLDETLAALRGLLPDVYKRLNKLIRADLTKVKTVADYHLAMAGGRAGKNYRVSMTSTGRDPRGRVFATSKEAAVFEFAGTKMRSRTGGPITPQGAGLVKHLEGFGKPGRFLWDAWDLQKVALERDLTATMGEAERELQAHLNAAGDVF